MPYPNEKIGKVSALPSGAHAWVFGSIRGNDGGHQQLAASSKPGGCGGVASPLLLSRGQCVSAHVWDIA